MARRNDVATPLVENQNYIPHPTAFQVNVLFPAAYAVVSGAMFALIVLILGLAFGLPWYAGPLSGAVLSLVLWGIHIHKYGWWWGNQQFIQSSTPPPSDEQKTVTIELRHETGFRRLDLPPGITLDDLAEFARQYKMRGLSMAAWIGSGNPFSRGKYEKVTRFLREAGILAWKDPDNRAQGMYVTKGGEAAMRHLASISHTASRSPTPQNHLLP